jgi:hypothetical protein
MLCAILPCMYSTLSAHFIRTNLFFLIIFGEGKINEALFIYSLFNSDYIESNACMIVNNVVA